MDKSLDARHPRSCAFRAALIRTAQLSSLDALICVVAPLRFLVATTALILTLTGQGCAAESQAEPISLTPLRPAPRPISNRQPLPSPARLREAGANTYPRTHYQRGMFFKQKGLVDNALVEFLKATHENPRLVGAFYEQALIFRQRGYLKLAESALEQALAVQPDFQQGRVLLATIRLEQGNLGGAVSELSRSLGLPARSTTPAAGAGRQRRLDAISGAAAEPAGGTSSSGDLRLPAGVPPTVMQTPHYVMPVPPLSQQLPSAATSLGSPGPQPALAGAQSGSLARAASAITGAAERAAEPGALKGQGERSTEAGRPAHLSIPRPSFRFALPNPLRFFSAGQTAKPRHEAAGKGAENSGAGTGSIATSPNLGGDLIETHLALPASQMAGAGVVAGVPPARVRQRTTALRSRGDQKDLQPASTNFDDRSATVRRDGLRAASELARLPGGPSDKPARPRRARRLRRIKKPHLPWWMSLFGKRRSEPGPEAAVDAGGVNAGTTSPARTSKGGTSTTQPLPMVVRQPSAAAARAPQAGNEEPARAAAAPGPDKPERTFPALVWSPEEPGSEQFRAVGQAAPAAAAGQAARAESTPGPGKAIRRPGAAGQETTAKPVSAPQGPFRLPAMPSAQSRWLANSARCGLPPAYLAIRQSQSEAPAEDEWTVKLRRLSEQGTASLSQGEAFMFSEQSGEAVLFRADGQVIRRQVAEPRAADELVKLRRPDIAFPQELKYNLSLLAKLLPPQKAQVPRHNQPAGFTLDELLQSPDSFWAWLKQLFNH